MQPRLNTLVIAGSPVLAYNAAACLAEAGHRVDVMGIWRFSPYRLSRFWQKYTRIDPASFRAGEAKIADQIESYCQHRQIDFVVPGGAHGTMLVLRNSDRIRSARLFPMPGFELFSRLRNKWTFSQIVRECGIPQPETTLLETPEQVDSVKIDYPLIVKPLTGSGALGVYEITSADELRRYALHCHKHGALPLLVQQLVVGRDIDLTMLANHGRVVAWTLQERYPGGEIRFVRDSTIMDFGRRIVERTGYHGVIDFDLRRNERSGESWVIEANARFPASLRYKLWAGVNLPALALQMELDPQTALPFSPPEGTCINYGVSPKHLLRALSRGRLTPANWSAYTSRAWRLNFKDVVPHSLLWIANKLRRPWPSPADTAQRLPSNSKAWQLLLALAPQIGSDLL